MLTGPQIILTLKVLVSAVTVLLIAALIALSMRKPRWHGRINTAFFVLTMLTVVGFEVLLQFVNVSEAFTPEAREALRVHLWFAVPSAILLPIMFFTGWTQRKRVHVAFATLFSILWLGTFITGVFFLPHT